MFTDGRNLPWDFDPPEALRRWPTERRPLLLHSGRFDARWARRSILAEPAGVFRFLLDGDGQPRSTWTGPAGVLDASAFHHRPFHDLRAILAQTPGIWIGCLSYDLGRFIERVPTHARADRGWPVIELGWCPGWLTHDAARGAWSAHGSWAVADTFPDIAKLPTQNATFSAGAPVSGFDRAAYETAVRRVIDYIGAGDIFQANLAQRFTAPFQGRPPHAARSLYDRLARVSPAWYGAYLEWGNDGSSAASPWRAAASTSPELFLELDAGRVVTRPIKGTRPASVSAEELRRSAKDTAELNMIVDLLRNDFGRVCAYGSVRVPQPREIESHPTIHHGVATVTGTLHPSCDVVDLLRATMPGGSVTGAPKVRAMEVIDGLEPARRGPYCGAIGWITRDAACFSVAIRTMLVEMDGKGGGRVDFSVGGGIVADSDPGHEYQETLDKAAAMLRALEAKW
ncbi:MAG: anthranilate synthase component I family protein [Planctomycetes bacterium]|nr:anthranilate synthase component I family protein [Planctomycetota bacterium]